MKSIYSILILTGLAYSSVASAEITSFFKQTVQEDRYAVAAKGVKGLYFWISMPVEIDCNSIDATVRLQQKQKFGEQQQFFSYSVNFFGTKMNCSQLSEAKLVRTKKIFVPMIAGQAPGSRDFERVNLYVTVPAGWKLNVSEAYEETETKPIEEKEVIDLKNGLQ